jgi:hypothetical protein
MLPSYLGRSRNVENAVIYSMYAEYMEGVHLDGRNGERISVAF